MPKVKLYTPTQGQIKRSIESDQEWSQTLYDVNKVNFNPTIEEEKAKNIIIANEKPKESESSLNDYLKYALDGPSALFKLMLAESPNAYKSLANGFSRSHISSAEGDLEDNVGRSIKGIERTVELAKTDPDFFSAIKIYSDWSNRPDKKANNVGMPIDEQVPPSLKPIWDKYKETIQLYNKAKSLYSVEGSVSEIAKLGTDYRNPNYAENVKRAKAEQDLPSLEEIYAAGPGVDLSTDKRVGRAFEKIGKRVNDLTEDIDWHVKDIEQRGEPSAQYLANEKVPGITGILYSIPGQLGMSSGEALTQVGTMGMSAAGGAMLSGAGTIPTILGVAAMTGVNFLANRYQRTRENQTELSDSRGQKINEYLVNDKINESKSKLTALEDRTDSELIESVASNESIDNNIINKAKTELIKNKILSPSTRDSLIRGIKNRTIKSLDKEVNNALDYADQGIDEYLQRNDSYMMWDVGESLALAIPGGKQLKALKVLAETSKVGKVAKTILKPIEKTIEYTQKYYERALGSTISKIGASTAYRTAKIITNPTMQILSEGFEEGGQYINSINYINNYKNTQNDSYAGSLVDGINAGITGARITLGDNVDHKYVDKDQLWLNQRSGLVLGAFMSGPTLVHKVAKETNDLIQDKKADGYVKSLIGEMIDHDARMNKSAIYVNSLFNGREKNTISSLENLAKNPPVGLTPEMIQEEIKMAKETFAIANSKQVVNYVKRTSSYGSDDHKLLTGLIVEHTRDYNNAKESIKERSDLLSSELKRDFDSDIAFKSKFEQISSELPITEEEQLNIYNLLHEFNATKAILANKERLDESTKSLGDKTVDSKANKAVKAELLSNMLSVKETLDSLYKLYELSEADIASISEPVVSDTSIGHVSAIVVAKAGLRYDADMINGLSGYKKIKGKDGKISYSKMTEEEHNKEVKTYTDKYRGARLSEKRTQETLEELDIAAENKAKVDEEKVIKTVHGSTSTDTKVPEPIIAAQKPVEPVLSPVETLSPENNTIVPELPKASPEGSVSDMSKPQIADEKAVEKAVAEQQAQPVSPVQAENIFLEGDMIDASAVAVEVDIYGNVVESATDISGLARNAMAIMDEAEDAARFEVISSGDSNTVENSKDLEQTALTNQAVANEEGLITAAVEANTSEQLNILEEVLPGTNPEIPINTKTDALSHTLFHQPTRQVDGFEHGSELVKLSRQRNAFSGAEIEIVVSSRYSDMVVVPGTKKMKSTFDINDRNTWDNATIEVQITKDGKKYIMFIKAPKAARNEKTSANTPRYGEDLISGKLIPFRNSIIELSIEAAKVGGKVTADPITVSNWAYQENRRMDIDENGNPISLAVNRPLFKIPGFGIKKKAGKPDFHSLNQGNFKLVYGKDAITVGPDGMPSTTMAKMNTGNIMWVTTDYKTGDERRVKLNKKGFDGNDGVAELIYKLAFELKANNTDKYKIDISKAQDGSKMIDSGMTALDILKLIVPFGEGTSRNNTSELALRQKQFYITERGVIHFGVSKAIDENGQVMVDKDGKDIYIDNMINLNLPSIDSDQKQSALDYIKQSFVWTIGKDHLWNDNGGDNKVSDVIPNAKRIIESNNLDSIQFAPGFKIDREDLDMNWVGYIVKSGRLLSDKGDQIFNDPFMYIGEPSVALPGAPIAALIVKANEVPIAKESALETPAEASTATTETLSTGRRSRPRATSVYNDNYKSKIKVDTEIAWLRDRLGLDLEADVEVVQSLISIGGNIQAMGLMREDSIVLWSDAEEGTAYHEAYHRVSLLLFSRGERLRAYEAARKAYPQLNGLTNKEVEEFLAEKFKEYKLGLTNVNEPSAIKTLFRKLYNFIQKLFGLNNRDLNRIFKNIESGVYRNVPINQNSLNEFNAEYGDGAAYGFKDKKFKHIPTKANYDNIVDALTYELFAASGIQNMDDVPKLDFDLLKKMISNTIEQNQYPERNDLYREILDRFDFNFEKDIKKNIEYMQIKEIEDVNAVDNTTQDDADATIQGSIADHTKASYESSKKDNILAAVKMFISTIPATEFDGESTVYIEDSLTGFNKFIPFDISWNTMISVLNDAASPTEMESIIRSRAKVNPFFDELLYKLSEVKDQNFITQFWNSMYSYRHNFINVAYNRFPEAGSSAFSVRDSNTDRESRVLPLAWGAVFAGNPEIYTYHEDGRVSFNPAIPQAAINRRQYLIDNVCIPFGTNRELVNVYINGKEIKSLADQNDLNAVISEYVDILNSIGIMVDNKTIMDRISSHYEGDDKGDSSAKKLIKLIAKEDKVNKTNVLFTTVLKDLIKNNGLVVKKTGKGRSNTYSPQSIYAGEKFAKAFSDWHASSHISMQEIMVMGADGAKLYPISQNNTMSDKVRLLNQSLQERALMENVTYISGTKKEDGSIPGSIVLDQLKKDKSKRLEVLDFIKLYEEESGDRGRDAMDVTALEDYVIKMTLLRNNVMVSPTMADKNFTGGIAGIELFHENIEYERTEVRYGDKSKHGARITYGSNTVNQFLNYADAEFATIKKAFEMFSSESNQNDLIDVYHTGGTNSDTNIKWSGNHGNGLRFRHMDKLSILQSVNGKFVKSFVNLNEIIEAEVKLKGPIDGMRAAIERLEKGFFNKSAEERSIIMQQTLQDGLTAQLEYAKEIGLIEFDTYESGDIDFSTLRNLNLDKGLITNKSIAYSTSAHARKGGAVISNYGEQAAVIDLMADMYINQSVSIIEFEKLISKDPAFYKTADAKIKRLSSILSTGGNLRTDFPEGHELFGVTEFTTAEAKDNIIISDWIQDIENTFVAGEINDLLVENGKQSIPNLLQLIANSQLDEKVRDVELFTEYNTLLAANETEFKSGEVIGKHNSSGYAKVNETDATVFITPNMFRSIKIRLGEWSNEMQEAFDLLESDDQSWATDPEAYAKATRLIMHPLKTIYFGGTYTVPEVGLDIPKLDKMAMFTLFKAVVTGDLANVRERMLQKDNGIDMIAFESAVKVGNDRATSFYTDRTNNEMSDLSTMKISKQKYANLRKQLVTDPHHGSEITVATQPIKAIMSNIVEDQVYDNITVGNKQGATGTDLINIWNSVIAELSDRGVLDVEKELGMTLNENGEYIFDNEKLFDMLVNDAEDSKMSSDVINILMSSTKDNPIPLQAMMDNKWHESRILSNIAKKTIDVNTPGGMFIQMSAFGLKSIDASNLRSGKITQEQYEAKHGTRVPINNGNKLNFWNKDGSMDCAISINLFVSILPEEVKSLSFEEQRQWLIDNNVIGSNSNPSAVGYRVPTQGLSSISALKIMDVIPSTIGDTIILPSEFTKLTGSDFDIDKLYVSRYAYKNGKKVKFLELDSSTIEQRIRLAERVENRDAIKAIIKKHKADVKDSEIESSLDILMQDLALKSEIDSARKSWIDANMASFASRSIYGQNSIEAVQNKLIDVFMAALTDKARLHETRQPLDTVTDYLKDKTLAKIEELRPVSKRIPILNYVSPSYQSKKRQEYGTGKRGIAPFALNNAHHALTQITNLSLKEIPFLNDLGIYNLHGIKGRDGKRILDWLSAMINAHVDVAKDPYIIRLNANQYTYNTLNFLLRTGVGENSFYFLSQPSLIRLANSVNNTKGRYGQDQNISNYEKENRIITSLKAEYAAEMTKLASTSAQRDIVKEVNKGNFVNKKVFDIDFLSAQIEGESNKKTFSWYYNQLMVLDTFLKLKPYAEELSDLVRASQIDNKKAGNTFTLQRLYGLRVNRIKSNSGSMFKDVSTFFSGTFLDKKMNNSVKLSKRINKNMFYRTIEAIEDMTDNIVALTGKSNIDMPEVTSKVSSTIDAYIKSEFYDRLAIGRNVDIKGMFFGRNNMSNRLWSIMNKIETGQYAHLSTNTLIQSLKLAPADISANPIYQMPSFIENKNTNTSDPRIIDNIKEDWGELLDDPNTEISEWAKDFILYQFYTTGENSNMHAVKLAEDIRKEIGYYDFTKNKLNEIAAHGLMFKQTAMSEIFKNRWYDDDIVPTINNYTVSKGPDDGQRNEFFSLPSVYQYKGNEYPAVFINEKPRYSVGVNLDEQSMHTPYVKVLIGTGKQSAYVLYELIGTVPAKSEKVRPMPVYKAIGKRGIKDSGKYIYEFNRPTSMIPGNNLPSESPFNMSADGIHTYLYDRNQIRKEKQTSKEGLLLAQSKFEGFMPINSFELVPSKFSDNALGEMELDTTKSFHNTLKNIASNMNPLADLDVAALRAKLKSYGYNNTQIDAGVYEVARMQKDKLFEPTNITEASIVEAQEEIYNSSVESIYNNLGNETKSENIRIVKWYDIKDANEPFIRVGDHIVNIISTRIKNSNNHFGNPFSPDPEGKAYGLIKTETTREAVEKYIDWVINSDDSRAKWIRSVLITGEFKEKPILYYKELGEPSHATALDYLINKYDWTKTNLQATEATLTESDTNVLPADESALEELKTSVGANLQAIMDMTDKANPVASIYFESIVNTQPEMTTKASEETFTTEGVVAKTAEQVWDEQQDKIKAKHAKATFEMIQQIEIEMGIEAMEEYINKCY